MKRIVTVLIMVVCVQMGYSQIPSIALFPSVSLSFCSTVESDGACNFNNTKFIASKDSLTQKVFMRVKGEDGDIGQSKLFFKVYTVSPNGDEKLDVTLPLEIQTTWMYAWTWCIFPAPGKYLVKVYNDTDQLLCSNRLEFFEWSKF